ncbi:MAG: FAD-dependent oxidoreductase [Acidimicrobiia bacterium]|nr:FAD-dependent oxidoreductase [Acidimicrobiia bacterium]
MTWREPARDLPVIGSPDVLVVGAGSAGVAAAIAAARRGADTWLVERLSYVGGLATGGLINLLLTLDDGHGDQVVRGLCQELVDILDTRGAARYPPRREWGSTDVEPVERWRRWGLIWGAPPDVVRYSVAFDPEDFIDVAYENLSAAGVRLRLHSWCVAVHAPEGCVEAVVLESKAGRQVVRPRVVIDTTGDGDVLAGAGARHESVKVHPYLWFRLGGAHDLADDRGWSDGIFFRTTAPGRVLVPWGGPGAVDDKIDPLDPDELTRAELECRRDAMREAERLRAEVPELADAWRDDVAKQLGITESRRLVGDFVLEKDHGDVGFPDSVARTGHWTKRGVVYDIPYRCLTTPVVSNLLTAGRCISVSRYVHQATKEIPAAMATGEAAGAAAVHSLDVGGDVRTVDVDALRRDLYGNGAVVGGPVVDRTEAEPG